MKKHKKNTAIQPFETFWTKSTPYLIVNLTRTRFVLKIYLQRGVIQNVNRFDIFDIKLQQVPVERTFKN